MMPSVNVGVPLALLGLALIPVLWVATLHSRALQSGPRRLLTTLSRAVVVAFVVFALADVRVVWPTSELAIAVVMDESASIDEAERSRVREDLASLDGRIFYEPPGTDTDLPLATRIQLAVATLPTDRVRRVVVATDGHDPTEDVRSSLDAARRAGATVSILPVGDAPPIDTAAVTGLAMPRLVRAGETVDVGVSVLAATSGERQIGIVVRDDPPAKAEIALAPGVTTAAVEVTFPEEEGVYPVRVGLDADGAGRPENDTWTTMVQVLSRPRVLVVHDPAAPNPVLAEVLSDAGFRVTTQSVADAPTTTGDLEPYGLVVLEEVELTGVSEQQQIALRSWVEDHGGGLITISGAHPVGREPARLREIEPVSRPPAIPEPRPLELVLAIDRSGSMEGRPLAQARAAGIAAVRALRQDARVGTVAFSGGADHVMPPIEVGEARDTAADFIGRITAGGGTSIDAALHASNAIVSNDDRYIRHVILLSDGHSAEGPAIAAAQSLAGRGVSITTITLGAYSSLMAEIARIGRGRYHVTRNPGSLPALFVREAQYRQPPAHRQVSFRPEVVTPHRMVRAIDFAEGPPLLGYALSALRPGADVVLDGPSHDPVLAHWHRGVGQVATFTSATTGGWANEWRAWPGFRTFWSQAAWTMIRARMIDPVDVRVEPAFRRPETAVITILGSVDADDGELDRPVVEVHRPGDDGRAPDLRRVGPGIWQAHVEVGLGFLVTARRPADPEPTAAVAFDRPYPDELEAFGADPVELARWAEVGGGRVLPELSATAVEGETARVGQSLEMLFLALALAFYLGGLVLLRLPERRAVKPMSQSSRPSSEAPPASRSKEAA